MRTLLAVFFVVLPGIALAQDAQPLDDSVNAAQPGDAVIDNMNAPKIDDSDFVIRFPTPAATTSSQTYPNPTGAGEEEEPDVYEPIDE